MPAHATLNPKRLIIINSYNENAPWVQDFVTPFMIEAARDSRFSCDFAHINATLIRTDSLYKKVSDGIFARFRSHKPDYLIIIGPQAFSLRQRIKREWGNIPMLYIATSDSVIPEGKGYKCLTGDRSALDIKKVPLSSLRSQYNFTFVQYPDLYKENIDMMVQMQPDMKKLAFASDELFGNMELEKKIREYISAKYPKLEYEWLVASQENRKHLQEYLTNSDRSINILLSSWYFSRESAYGYPILVTGDMNIISTAPRAIFTLKQKYLDNGATCGYFADKQELLNKSFNIFKKMLNDEDMRKIPFVYPTKSFAIVNYKQAIHEGLALENCPKNTIFIGKPKGFLEQYFWEVIIGGIIFLSLMTIVILIIVFQRKRMRQMALHDKMVNNMPICYMIGKIHSDANGNPIRIDISAGNSKAAELVKQNTDDGDSNKLFEKAYILELVENVCNTKQTIRFTHYFNKTDTSYEIFACQTLNDEDIELFGIDVTDKIKSAESLVEASKTLEMTLSVAHIVPWKWDLNKHIISCEANKIIQHMNFTKRSESTEGTTVFEDKEYLKRIHPDDISYVKQIYNDLITGNKQYVKGEFRIITENNGKKVTEWIEINASVSIYDEDGRPAELIGSLLIITTRKKQEANLIAAKEAAKESDRLKSAFLANMSHEIRTPLNAIVGFSSLMATTNDKEEQKQFINIIESNNQLLLQLISDILDLSKVEANTLEFIYKPTDLNELISGVKETVNMRVKSGVELSYTLGAAECCIETESNRLAQVLINLLTNACKFTNAGSITFGYEIRGSELYFFVRDTGIGISKEGQTRIFQRFTKLNDFAQGTGLGLSISQSIIEKMHGNIGVESEGEGKGSTFWFTLPYAPVATLKEEAKTEKEETPKEVIKRDNITILIAEDNKSNYLLFKSLLGTKYNLIHAWNGVEAVEMFSEYNPQLIIMDINMPKKNGYEATQEIRKISTKVPIIAVTAYAFASDKEKIMSNGFNSYISKPINAKSLDKELQSALGSHFIML